MLTLHGYGTGLYLHFTEITCDHPPPRDHSTPLNVTSSVYVYGSGAYFECQPGYHYFQQPGYTIKCVGLDLWTSNEADCKGW